jgi:hypothetical protein
MQTLEPIIRTNFAMSLNLVAEANQLVLFHECSQRVDAGKRYLAEASNHLRATLSCRQNRAVLIRATAWGSQPAPQRQSACALPLEVPNIDKALETVMASTVTSPVAR